MKIVTLAELGKQLPSGLIAVRGEFQSAPQAFDLKPWTLSVEREAVSLRTTKPAPSVGQYVTRLLARVVTHIGPHSDFQAMKPENRELFLRGLPMGDVLYMYTWLRLEALEKALSVALTCARCESSFNFVGDLDTLKVSIYDQAADVLRPFELPRGYVEQRGVQSKKLTLAAIPWSTLEGARGRERMADLEVEILKSSIVSAEGIDTKGAPLVATDVFLANLTRLDIQRLTQAVDELSPGPDMKVEGKCLGPNGDGQDSCGQEFSQQIDWTFDSFFSTASLPTPKKTYGNRSSPSSGPPAVD